MVADLSQGACAGKANSSYAISDPFYPDNSERRKNSKPVDYREAKEICDRCTIRALCLKDALSEDVQWGYRAGMTADERQALKTLTGGKPANKYNLTQSDLASRFHMWQSGWDDARIAEAHTKQAVKTWRNTRGYASNSDSSRQVHTPEQNALKRELYDAGYPDRDIAAAIPCRQDGIRKWRAKSGLKPNPIRERVPA